MEQKMLRHTFFNANFIEINFSIKMSGTIFFKQVYSASLNKTKSIFWGQKILRSIFHMSQFIKYFNKF